MKSTLILMAAALIAALPAPEALTNATTATWYYTVAPETGKRLAFQNGVFP
jgi:hypothetical protein